MKQQIIVSGLGGQGVLFLTRVIAQVAVNREIPVLTAETHGMAQRGGTVLSTIKVGAFASPLVRSGQADVGLLLWEANLEVHRSLLKSSGTLLINSDRAGELVLPVPAWRRDLCCVTGSSLNSGIGLWPLIEAWRKKGHFICSPCA